MDQQVYEVTLTIQNKEFKIYVAVPNTVPEEYVQLVIEEETFNYLRSCINKMNYKVVSKNEKNIKHIQKKKM